MLVSDHVLNHQFYMYATQKIQFIMHLKFCKLCQNSFMLRDIFIHPLMYREWMRLDNACFKCLVFCITTIPIYLHVQYVVYKYKCAIMFVLFTCSLYSKKALFTTTKNLTCDNLIVVCWPILLLYGILCDLTTWTILSVFYWTSVTWFSCARPLSTGCMFFLLLL